MLLVVVNFPCPQAKAAIVVMLLFAERIDPAVMRPDEVANWP